MNRSEILKLRLLAFFIASLLAITGCDDDRVTDFGYDGKISGKIVDSSNNPLSGDTTSDNLTVVALGELDTEPMRMRVLGDGTYTNTHLYPQKYQVWVEGAVETVPEVTIDLTGSPKVVDFTVTPFINVAVPTLSGSPAATEVTVNYTFAPTAGYTPNARVVYVSTVMYPSQATGSGAWYKTITRNVSADSGTETITGLESGKRYFIRCAARATGTNRWNLGHQIEITTP